MLNLLIEIVQQLYLLISKGEDFVEDAAFYVVQTFKLLLNRRERRRNSAALRLELINTSSFLGTIRNQQLRSKFPNIRFMLFFPSLILVRLGLAVSSLVRSFSSFVPIFDFFFGFLLQISNVTETFAYSLIFYLAVLHNVIYQRLQISEAINVVPSISARCLPRMPRPWLIIGIKVADHTKVSFS